MNITKAASNLNIDNIAIFEIMFISGMKLDARKVAKLFCSAVVELLESLSPHNAETCSVTWTEPAPTA